MAHKPAAPAWPAAQQEFDPSRQQKESLDTIIQNMPFRLPVLSWSESQGYLNEVIRLLQVALSAYSGKDSG